LILVGGLRWETGTDWDSYYTFFNNNVTYNEFVNSEFELFYALLSFISKTLINSYTFFLLVFCSLTISIKIYGFCKLSGYNFIFLTILMYYANQLGDISATRQSLALSFGLLGLIFIVNKQLIPYILTSLIAFYFHSSAIITFLAIPLFFFTFSKKQLIFLMSIGFLVGLAMSFAGGISNILFTFLMQGDGRIAEKITAYQDITEAGYSTTGSAIDPKISYILGTIRRCFVLIPAILFYDRLDKNSSFKKLISIYVLGSLIYLIFTPIMQVLNRLSAYFDLAEYLILPLFLTISNNKYVRITIYIILVLYTFTKFYSTTTSFWSYYNPYRLCF